MEHIHTNKQIRTCSFYRVTQVTKRELFLCITKMFLGHFQTKCTKEHLAWNGTYCLSGNKYMKEAHLWNDCYVCSYSLIVESPLLFIYAYSLLDKEFKSYNCCCSIAGVWFFTPLHRILAFVSFEWLSSTIWSKSVLQTRPQSSRKLWSMNQRQTCCISKRNNVKVISWIKQMDGQIGRRRRGLVDSSGE